MTGPEDGSRLSIGGIDRRHLFGAAVLALAVVALAVAVPGSIAAQDQPDDPPGEPVKIYGEAVDELGNTAPAGTTIYAMVNGSVEGSITVTEAGQFGGPDWSDGHIAVDDSAGEVATFVVDGPDGTVALDTVNLSSADEVVEVELTFPVASFLQIDVTNNNQFATDTTGDGLLNDVDGNGEFDIFDVQALFDGLSTQKVQTNASAFNFAGVDDGTVSIFDVQALFSQLTE
jgi:hypothetical protein